MSSMTSREEPEPKLRVTRRSVTAASPQLSQMSPVEVDGDDDEAPGRSELDDALRDRARERDTADDELCLSSG